MNLIPVICQCSLYGYNCHLANRPSSEKIRKEFIGWDSMITGQQIPSEEMEGWLSLRHFDRSFTVTNPFLRLAEGYIAPIL